MTFTIFGWKVLLTIEKSKPSLIDLKKSMIKFAKEFVIHNVGRVDEDPSCAKITLIKQLREIAMSKGYEYEYEGRIYSGMSLGGAKLTIEEWFGYQCEKIKEYLPK